MTGFFADGQWWDVCEKDDAEIRDAAARLTAASIEDALGEARKLWCAAKHSDETSDWLTAYMGLIDRRAAREPMSHLLGYRDFYQHRFAVSADVLDPRPDTEALVDAALDVPFQTVLDLGTGSGCILLSLLAARPGATGVGTDLSAQALQIAGQNRDNLDLGARAKLILSDWYEAVTGTFDLIVSNPPYIAAHEMAGLQPEVQKYEPRMALTDEADGLRCYRAIIAGAHDHLATGGWLMVEIGPTQAPNVTALMAAQGFANVTVKRDIDGRDRVVCAENAPN